MANGNSIQRNGIVAFLDALGTKGAWKDNPKMTLELWEKINDEIDDIIEDRLNERAETSKIDIQKDAFSDTIIMTGSQESNNITFWDIAIFCSIIAATIAGGLLEGLFFRGCVSVGYFYRSKRMILGEAVDEAAEYYTLPQWIGGSMSPSAHIFLTNRDTYGKEMIAFLRYDIPLKTGLEKGWAIDWPRLVIEEGDAFEFKYKLGKLLEEAKNTSVALKIRNTLDFFYYSESQLKNRSSYP